MAPTNQASRLVIDYRNATDTVVGEHGVSLDELRQVAPTVK